MDVDYPLNQESSRLNFDLCLMLLQEVSLQSKFGVLVSQIVENSISKFRDLLRVSNIELVLEVHVFGYLLFVSCDTLFEFFSHSVLPLLA